MFKNLLIFLILEYKSTSYYNVKWLIDLSRIIKDETAE